MLFCGPSLLPHYGSSVPNFLHVENHHHHHHQLSRRSLIITCKSHHSESIKRVCYNSSLTLATFLTTAVVIASIARAEEFETLSNIPQTLSGECKTQQDCKKAKIQKPKSRKAESCTGKCVTTCIRGGEGSPGEGPFNVIRPLVVFKQGFRTRQYCLVECSDICNLINSADNMP
ncbi:uncharacterized protein LOC123888854 [Trifolium pratense]|uniref:uncharacterized protein LOC123888854 n=1 Tax=Trifolium pratense TaxID=57577 RepID=UPI001E6932C3|nr:uncharacterized protein LOC123888854 [Trifolium pratense]